MLEALFYLAGFGAAMWLAVALVDAIAAVWRREWRFSLRGVLILTAMIATVAGVFAFTMRK